MIHKDHNDDIMTEGQLENQLWQQRVSGRPSRRANVITILFFVLLIGVMFGLCNPLFNWIESLSGDSLTLITGMQRVLIWLISGFCFMALAVWALRSRRIRMPLSGAIFCGAFLGLLLGLTASAVVEHTNALRVDTTEPATTMQVRVVIMDVSKSSPRASEKYRLELHTDEGITYVFTSTSARTIPASWHRFLSDSVQTVLVRRGLYGLPVIVKE